MTMNGGEDRAQTRQMATPCQDRPATYVLLDRDIGRIERTATGRAKVMVMALTRGRSYLLEE